MNNKMFKVLELYFDKNMKPVDIAKELNVSKSAITQILQKDSRYENEKNRRKQENKIKHSKETKDYIKRQRKINQFFNKVDDLVLKNIHNRDAIELSTHSTMSNETLRRWCSSMYIYNKEKNRYEFDTKSSLKPADFPMYIKV